MSERVNSESSENESDLTECKERSRLLYNSTLEHCRTSSPRKVYSSTAAQMDFHCHDISTSSEKNRAESSRAAKRKLIIACLLVILFIILEVIGGIASGSL